MKLTITALLFYLSFLLAVSVGAPVLNFDRWLQNSRLLRKALGPLDEEDIANFTKEELREMKYNLNQPIEPSPLSENGSGSGDTESGDLYICEENEFICKDGNCLPMDKVCDENFDCEDKSDEDKSYCKKKRKEDKKKEKIKKEDKKKKDEENKCTYEQFTCDNGKCIPGYHRCDGDNDCGDDSDEDRDRCLAIDCPRSNNVHCPSNGVCIEEIFKCDEIQDCPDNWDEKFCPY